MSTDKIKEEIVKKEEKKKVARKKEDKKYLIIMIVLFAVSAVGGFLVGWGMRKLEKSGFSFPDISDNFIETVTYLMPAIFFGINLIFLIFGLVFISKARKQYELWDGEDEDFADKIEEKVGIPLSLSSVLMVINMFLFAVCVNLDMQVELDKSTEKVIMIINLIVFIFSFVVMFIVQKKALDLTKDMNPEKEGSLYDVKFAEKWENSCDEAQKLMVYKAAKTAFTAMTSMCMTLWVVCLIGDMFMGFGLIPVTLVSIIWITGIISYLVACAKLEKAKNNI